MHMADALLSPLVGGTMCAASAAANAFAVRRIKQDELGEKKIPVMGVMGAFVFAAQMINFTIPATGSSGHIGGGILLAVMLGGCPALLSITAVLAIQCLFFADGGLLALGCNVFNIGVIPCLVAYPLLFRPLLKKGVTAGRLTAASVLAAVVGLQLGSFGVVLETSLSGVAALPFAPFALLMQPIHLAIGLVEGFVTAAILCFVYKARPELIESTLERTPLRGGLPVKKLVIALAAAALLLGGGLSLFASSNPDGLEWSIERIAGSPIEDPAPGTAVLPGYNYEGGESPAGTSLAGIVGGGISFALAGATALVVAAVKKRRNR